MGQGWSLFGDIPTYSREVMERDIQNIPRTFGDQTQVGRVWVARSGKGASSHGHLSVLVAVDGRCEFNGGNDDIPTKFYGAQYHIGLKKDDKGHFSRSTTFKAESWYTSAPNNQDLPPRPFVVDDQVQLYPCLNEDGSYAQIKNIGNHDPALWAFELKRFAIETYNALTESQDEIKAAEQGEAQLEIKVNSQMDGEVIFRNKQIPNHPKRWSAAVNCHTFAVRFVERLSLRWPADLAHSGEYKDWLVDTLLTSDTRRCP